MHFKFCPYCGTKTIQKEQNSTKIYPYCTQCKILLQDIIPTYILCAIVNEQNEVAVIRNVAENKNNCLLVTLKIGEYVEEAVRRLAKEEIGLEVEWLQYIGNYPCMEKKSIMFGYKVYVKKADFKLSNEVDFAKWVKFDNVLENLEMGSNAWYLVKRCILSWREEDMDNHIYKDIDLIRVRPRVFLEKKSVYNLFLFLYGYRVGSNSFNNSTMLFQPLPFYLFNAFVANYYHESACMGWCGIILKQTNQDEEKGLELFFELYDIFRSIKIIGCEMAELTPENIAYHNTVNTVCKQYIMTDGKTGYQYNYDEVDFDKGVKVSIYIHAQKVYCIKLTDNYGYLFVVEYQDGMCCDEQFFTVYKDKIIDHVEESFGKVKWKNIDSSVFGKKRIYSSRMILDAEGHYQYRK